MDLTRWTPPSSALFGHGPVRSVGYLGTSVNRAAY
jgi:hypothetical protein